MPTRVNTSPSNRSTSQGTSGSGQASGPGKPESAPRRQSISAENHPGLNGLGTLVKETNAKLKKEMPGVYETWAPFSATSGISGMLRHFAGATPATTQAALAATDAGLPLQAVEIVQGAVAAVDAEVELAKARKQAQTAPPFTLEATEASSALRKAKGDVTGVIAPTVRGDILGGYKEATNLMSALKHPLPIPTAVAPLVDGVLAEVTGAAYIGGGLLQNAKVNGEVDEAEALSEAVMEPASQRKDSNSATMRQLDEAALKGDLPANVHSILRTRSEAQVKQFLANFGQLNKGEQQRLREVLHFSSTQIKTNTMLNFGRATNLNTASVRRAAREEVIDAFIERGTATGKARLFDELKRVRNEALGARTAPNTAGIEKKLHDAGFGPDEFRPNVLEAVALSGKEREFVARYRKLPPEDRERVRLALHFGSWSPWKPDSTLPTTKHQRSDIRAELVRQFADGASLDRLDELKVRYSQKVLPLRTGRTQPRPAQLDPMSEEILAFDRVKLDTLKEEKQNAKVQIAYGATNMLMGIFEMVPSPAAAGAMVARATLSAPYYVYNGSRGLVSNINRRNAQPAEAALREEAVLYALPGMRMLIQNSGADTRRLQNPQQFLRDELGLSDAEIHKVDTLQRAGKAAEARAILARKNPDANVLVALRVLAENMPDEKKMRDFINTEAPGLLDTVAQPSNPEKTFEALKKHFIDDASYNPSAGIAALAKRLSEGKETADFGFDSARYLGRPPERIAQELQQKFERENPWFASRMFVDKLFGGGLQAVDARELLRRIRFNETEIAELQNMPKKEAWTKIYDHVFGETLQSRFSTQTLNQQGRDHASEVVDRMRPYATGFEEPLTWRRNFENAGVKVIENAGTPGLDSMLYALYQHFSGKSDSSSSEMHRKVMEARLRVMRAIDERNTGNEKNGTTPTPKAGVDVTKAEDLIVILQKAGEAFGKPDPTVKIVLSSGEEKAKRVGPASADPNAPNAAVLCHDVKTGRTFALDGGAASRMPPQADVAAGVPPVVDDGNATQLPPPDLGPSLDEHMFDNLESRVDASSAAS